MNLTPTVVEQPDVLRGESCSARRSVDQHDDGRDHGYAYVMLVDTATYTVTATNSAGNTTFGLSLKVGPATASACSQTNLVSNGAGRNEGRHAPGGIVGLALSATSPAWTANNVTQSSTVYDGTGNIPATVVTIPAGVNGAANPTGIVVERVQQRLHRHQGWVAPAGPARFIFAGQAGMISGWSPTADAANAITDL